MRGQGLVCMHAGLCRSSRWRPLELLYARISSEMIRPEGEGGLLLLGSTSTNQIAACDSGASQIAAFGTGANQITAFDTRGNQIAAFNHRVRARCSS